MRLALSLRRTLSEIAEMPGAEFRLWQEFMRTEPIGQRRDDMNFALLRMQIAGIAGAKNQRIDDYLILWGEQPEAEEIPVVEDPAFYREQFQKMVNGE